MARLRESSAPKTMPKTIVVPDWAKKVKEYREGAGFTQADLQKAMKAPVNTLSLIERGKRLFSAAARAKFFELIGKPEDVEIPVRSVRETKAKPQVVPKPKKASKPSNPAAVKGPARISKGRKPAATVAPETTPVSGEALPEPASPAPKEMVAPVIPAAPPTPEPVQAAPRILAKKGVEAKQTPALPPSPSGLSPVKEMVLHDIARILGNPGLSDSQAKNLHGLFTSLAVNVLLGG